MVWSNQTADYFTFWKSQNSIKPPSKIRSFDSSDINTTSKENFLEAKMSYPYTKYMFDQSEHLYRKYSYLKQRTRPAMEVFNTDKEAFPFKKFEQYYNNVRLCCLDKACEAHFKMNENVDKNTKVAPQ